MFGCDLLGFVCGFCFFSLKNLLFAWFCSLTVEWFTHCTEVWAVWVWTYKCCLKRFDFFIFIFFKCMVACMSYMSPHFPSLGFCWLGRFLMGYAWRTVRTCTVRSTFSNANTYYLFNLVKSACNNLLSNGIALVANTKFLLN